MISFFLSFPFILSLSRGYDFCCIQNLLAYHDMNSCDDGRPSFSFSLFPLSLFFLIVTVLLFYTNFIFCWLSDIDLMKWAREHLLYKTQLLSFNVIYCLSLILTTPSFSACLLVCLFVLCYQTLSFLQIVVTFFSLSFLYTSN